MTMRGSATMDSGPREVNLLVHIAAASGAKDDARYRAQAEAYLVFEPFSSIKHTARRSAPQEGLASPHTKLLTGPILVPNTLPYCGGGGGGDAEADNPLHGGTTSVIGPPPPPPQTPDCAALPTGPILASNTPPNCGGGGGNAEADNPLHGGTTSVIGPPPPPPQTPDCAASLQPAMSNCERRSTTVSRMSLQKRSSPPTMDSARKRPRLKGKTVEEEQGPSTLGLQLPEESVLGRKEAAPLPTVPALQPSQESNCQSTSLGAIKGNRLQERLTRDTVRTMPVKAASCCKCRLVLVTHVLFRSNSTCPHRPPWQAQELPRRPSLLQTE